MATKQNIQPGVNNFEHLVHSIREANHFFLNQVQRQVNTALTLRNWIIGYYIIEYQQKGEDRAAYGQKLYVKIAEELKATKLESIRERHLYLCKDFYLAYPHFLRAASAKTYLIGFQDDEILRTLSAKSISK